MPRVKTQDKEHAIVRAAARVFGAQPFHEASIDDVAADAGVGKGTIYRYFETKEDLYFAAVLDGLDELSSALEALLPAETSPAKRLEMMAREVLRFCWDRRALLTLLQSEDRQIPTWEAELDKRRQVLGRLAQTAIAEGVRRGEFRKVDPRLAADLFRGMLRAASFLRREEDTLEGLVEQILGIFTRGIAAEAR